MSYADIVRLLQTEEPIARDDVRRWIESGDLLTWSAVYTLTDSQCARIEPEIPSEEQVEFTRRYLLRCIAENPAPGEHLHGGYEAAWELAACMKQWRRAGGRAAAALRGIAVDLEKLYGRSDQTTQNRILCGVLEHAFEDPALRRFFVGWERDAELREVYRLALEWGSAHEEG
ncbi:MAG TPA: hypothetical protein VND45_03555 [Thermoanaerobaculia bacterium]|jgi:hypothetical protein|nr:hypothetical protein [Thermoanaerobaculia bacterium]